ncbi:hypothetical protein MMC24_003723 [Lignoscripta atroalba]|nr:hypothetical protein [Lignoscripta atroalba]
MFGIGSNSTQTSLASVETTPSFDTLDPGIQGSSDDFPGCTNDTSGQALPNGAPRGFGDLSPIGEANSTDGRSQVSRGRSALSSHSHEIPPPAAEPPLVASTVTRSQDRGSNDRPQPLQPKIIHGRSPPHSSAPKRSQDNLTPGARARRWIRSMKNQMVRLKYRKSYHETLSGGPTCPMMKDSATMTEVPPTSSTVYMARNDAFTEASDVTHPIKRLDQNLDFVEASNHTEPDETVGDSSRAKAVKSGRINVKRREETLKRQVLQRPICHCDPQCHCRKGSVDVNISSDGGEQPGAGPSDMWNIPEPPLRIFLGGIVDPQPDGEHPHPIRSHSPSRYVTAAGTHLDPDQPSSSGEASSSAVRRQRQRSVETWTSTDTTVVESIGASTRGSQTRPPSRRANSLPAAPMHQVDLNQFFERHGLAVRMALRHEGRLNQIEALFGGETAPSPRPSTRNSDQISTPAPPARPPSPIQAGSEDGIEGRPSSHARATSLANLPDPGDDRTAELTNGDTTPPPQTSQARTPADRASGPTPQPHRPEDVPPPPQQPGPDELSTALESLDHPSEPDHDDTSSEHDRRE